MLTGDQAKQQAIEELGFPPPKASASPETVPGGGKWVIGHPYTFTSIINIVSRSYRWAFDEALRDSWTNSLAMRRDPVIMDALRSRQLPTTQLEWEIQGDNPDDADEQQAIKGLTEICKAIPRVQEIKKQLLEALFYGRYGVQFLPEWDWSTGKKRMIIRHHFPVNGDKIIYKYSGRIGILVHSWFTPDHPEQLEITDRGRAYFLNELEREQFIVHRFEPEDADFYEGEFAGQIYGVGLRSRLYWFWWLRSEVSAWLMDYLERVGAGGILIYWYEAGNTKSEISARDAAANADRDQALILPRPIGKEGQGPGVQQIEPSESGSNLLKTLITEYFDSVIRNYILGQTLTTRTGSTGMGSKVAEAHEDTFSRIIKDDALCLGDTLTEDLLSVLQKYNYPRCRSKLRWAFSPEKPNPKEFLDAAKSFFEMGGEIDEDQLRKVIGLSAPKPGAKVLKKPDQGGGQPGEAPPEGGEEQQGSDLAAMLGGSAPEEGGPQTESLGTPGGAAESPEAEEPLFAEAAEEPQQLSADRIRYRRLRRVERYEMVPG